MGVHTDVADLSPVEVGQDWSVQYGYVSIAKIGRKGPKKKDTKGPYRPLVSVVRLD